MTQEPVEVIQADDVERIEAWLNGTAREPWVPDQAIRRLVTAWNTRLSHSAALIEALEAYHAVVEELVCVWAGTNKPSSMDEEAWLDPEDGDDRWRRFARARSTLLLMRNNGNADA